MVNVGLLATTTMSAWLRGAGNAQEAELLCISHQVASWASPHSLREIDSYVFGLAFDSYPSSLYF